MPIDKRTRSLENPLATFSLFQTQLILDIELTVTQLHFP